MEGRNINKSIMLLQDLSSYGLTIMWQGAKVPGATLLDQEKGSDEAACLLESPPLHCLCAAPPPRHSRLYFEAIGWQGWVSEQFWPTHPPLPSYGSEIEPGVAWGWCCAWKHWRGGLSLSGPLAGSTTGFKIVNENKYT